MAKDGAEMRTVLCGACGSQTNHEVLFAQQVSGETADGDIRWWETYEVVQCRGCERIAFRIVGTSTEDFDPNTGDFVETETLFPTPTADRAPIHGYERFPARTRRVYGEVLKALGRGTPILAAVGLRALIESICLEQEVSGRNLAERIDNLSAMGLLSIRQAELLHTHRFLGNVAAHEIVAADPKELVAALDIAETLLKAIYVLPETASGIRTGSPARKAVRGEDSA